MTPDEFDLGTDAKAGAPSAAAGAASFAPPSGRHAGARAADDHPVTATPQASAEPPQVAAAEQERFAPAERVASAEPASPVNEPAPAEAPAATEAPAPAEEPVPTEAPAPAQPADAAEQVAAAALEAFGLPAPADTAAPADQAGAADQAATANPSTDQAAPPSSETANPDAAATAEAADAETAEAVTKLGKTLKFIRLFSDLASPSNIAIVVALLIVAITGYFGGWTAAEADTGLYKHLAAGDTVTADPFEITVTDMFFTDDPGPAGFANEDTVYLMMRAKVKNTAPRPVPQGVLAESFLVNKTDLPENKDSSQLERPKSIRAVDGTAASATQPGLEMEYWFSWEMPKVTSRPAEVRLSFVKHTWRASSLDGGHIWADPELVAVLTQPVAAEGQVK